MEFQKITNFLDINSDNKDLPKFVTKKWIEVYDQSEGNYDINKEIRIKTSMLRSDLCDFSDAYIVVKGTIAVNAPNNAKKAVAFKNNASFNNCISKIIKKQQVVYEIIIEMNQVILFLLILNLLNIKQVLQEILIILMKKLQMMMVMKLIILNMMQIKLVKMKLNLLFH